MIKTKNLLASLSLEIPVLEENQEGQLRGGFSAFDAALTVNELSNGDCNCNCSCGDNGNCNCNCSCSDNKNCNCDCTPTPKSKSNDSSQTASTILFGSSFLL